MPADAGVAGQIASMRAVVDGAVDGEEFVRAWFAGRSRALRHGERLRAPFARVLDDVFFLLEDEYTDDPALRGPDALTDEAMVERVRAALDRLSALDGWSGRS
ncbi:hypothetical protein [Cellulomonas telluris]|uniref:hypothetical protein n=1 Tax=Cellulomonas telluris TaxID=2306636 RepID=UPI0010A86077|nr:hypothetical protein [Cellulomonas telluris]